MEDKFFNELDEKLYELVVLNCFGGGSERLLDQENLNKYHEIRNKLVALIDKLNKNYED